MLLRQHSLVLLLVAMLIAGCSQPKDDQPKSVPVSQSEDGSHNGSQPPEYVECQGVFAEYEPNYPFFDNWVEDGQTVNADGEAPRGLFLISHPAVYANRKVGILFSYTGTRAPSAPEPSEKGKTFSFEVPEDFFTGNYVTIENNLIRGFQATP